MLETSISENFLDKFYHELNNHELVNSNKLNLFTLKVSNNSFAYGELIEELGNSLYHFALSRTEVTALKKADKLNTLIKKAKEKLIDYTSRNTDDTSAEPKNQGGELGEILLYCLLESHLKAPKILTKLEIKTSGQMYVHGADGVMVKKNKRENSLSSFDC